MNEYEGAIICNVHRGKGKRNSIVYAEIRSKDGTLLVAATLHYCANVLHERLTGEKR